jgi:hypothetical protein
MMSATKTRFRRAQRHLEAYEEPWKTGHDEAMRCRDFEAYIAEGVMVFEYIDVLNRGWRECVFRGFEEYDPLDDEAVKGCFVRWLAVADGAIAALADFEHAGYSVDGAEKLRACVEQVRTTLHDWVAPSMSKAAGLRVWNVANEEADELRALVNSPDGSAGRPKWEPVSLPEGDPSKLR